MESLQTNRYLDPFFDDATNQIFFNPRVTSFNMDGPIGVGKSSNFLMRAAYEISQCVEPIKIGNRLVRQSLWAGIRESENSAQATFLQLLEGGIFSPAIMAAENSPVKVYGSHPSYILVKHDLPDGTELQMKIECHGFNNEKSENRLRTREYMGALIPEMQGIPYNIYEVAVERCGRWRTADTRISKVINGKKYTLSGVVGLAIVLCDINIPERPHALYSEYYDNPNKDDLPTMFITPPSPLLYMPVEKASKAILEKYPVTRFEGNEVVWVPNPKVYNMTRHYEEDDENGKPIPWSGYNYWFNRLHRTDSSVRRYILGKPDTIGGESAIYSNFRNDSKTVLKKELDRTKPVYVGFDPGGYAGITMCQAVGDKRIHFFKEFAFEPSDKATTRKQFSDFFFPYCRKHFKNMTVIIVPDPASSWLGKNTMTGQDEDVLYQIRDELRVELQEHGRLSITYKIEPCMVQNQQVDVRINSLGFYIDKALMTVDPDMKVFIAALLGQYRRKKLKSGTISDIIDKDNRPYADVAESAQYPVVNILTALKKSLKNARQNKSTRRVYKVKRSR